MSRLHRLASLDLRGLATALRSGRLMPPYSRLAVGRHLDEAEAKGVSEELAELAEMGVPPVALGALLERLADARADLETSLVDLVCSGPETAGLPTRDTAVVVRELFASARESVLVAGFAVAQGSEVFRVLAERMAALPGLHVRLYLDVRRDYRDRTTRSDALLREFVHRFRTKEWPGGGRLPEVYYDPRSLDPNHTKRSSLHAKCVIVDSAVAFVSSANFTEAAQQRNIEVGVLIRFPAVATRLSNHFSALAAGGVLVPIRVL